MRERSMRLPRRRTIWSTHSSTAESIPRPSRSIFRKPASAQESLSHWQSLRPPTAARSPGPRATRGGAGVFAPLAELAALHRCVLDRNELDERAAGDDHAAGVLGEVPRK